MDKAFLSVQFGSLDYTDERIIKAITGSGLKERATFGGQIVTALKMALFGLWCVLCLPYVLLMKVVSTVCCTYRCSIELLRETWSVLCLVLNKRMLSLIGVSGIAAVYTLGLSGLVYWLCAVSCGVFCFVPTDIKMYLKFTAQIAQAWQGELDAPLSEDLTDNHSEVQVVKNKTGFACKIATRAIAKVGLLTPSKANKLVYQKVILDILAQQNVRYADRLRVLPLAIAACLNRPEEIQAQERCIEHLCQGSSSL